MKLPDEQLEQKALKSIPEHLLSGEIEICVGHLADEYKKAYRAAESASEAEIEKLRKHNCIIMEVSDDQDKQIEKLESELLTLRKFREEAMDMADYYGDEKNYLSVGPQWDSYLPIQNGDGGKKSRAFIEKWKDK